MTVRGPGGAEAAAAVADSRSWPSRVKTSMSLTFGDVPWRSSLVVVVVVCLSVVAVVVVVVVVVVVAVGLAATCSFVCFAWAFLIFLV